MLARLIFADHVALKFGAFFVGAVILIIGTFSASVTLADVFGEESIFQFLWQYLDIERENSAPEKFNHGVAFLSASLLLITAFATRSRAPLFLSILFAFIWFDDSQEFHEKFGVKLAETFPLPTAFGLDPLDFGELFAWGLAGLFLCCILFWALRRRRPGDFGMLILFFLPFLALVLCGVGADMVHRFISNAPGSAIGIIEDGGEMLCLAVTAFLAVGTMRNARAYYAAHAPHPAALHTASTATV